MQLKDTRIIFINRRVIKNQCNTIKLSYLYIVYTAFKYEIYENTQ